MAISLNCYQLKKGTLLMQHFAGIWKIHEIRAVNLKQGRFFTMKDIKIMKKV